MKVLLLGDASNYHRALASGLRQLGCDVTVASDGTGFMNTERDIDLRRRLPGKLGGLALWLRIMLKLRRRFTGYDVVQLSGPGFVSLRPVRLRKLFDFLRRHNKAVCLTAIGTDIPYIEQCLDPESVIRYNELRIGDGPGPLLEADPGIVARWNNPPLKEWTEYCYSHIDGAVSVLYEYDLSVRRRLPASKVAYGGIPIATADFHPVSIPAHPEPVRIFLGRHRHRMAEKGTDRLETAIRAALAARPGKGELIIVENRPYAEYLELLRSAHLVVDQAYSYTPATNALLAMAYGIPAVTGAEPEYYDFINQPSGLPQETEQSGLSEEPSAAAREKRLYPPDTERPIINTPPDVEGMTRMFIELLDHPEELAARGRACRRFVEKHNDASLVASRYLAFWHSLGL